MGNSVGVGEAARLLGEPPGRISNGFCRAWFDLGRCPLVAGRRLIPEDYLPALAAILRHRRRPSRRQQRPTRPADLA